MKKILLFLLIGLYMISFNSAFEFEFDNGIKYRNNDLAVDFENGYFYGLGNWFGLNEELGTVELKSHKSVNEILEVRVGSNITTMYYDFNFKDIYKDGLGEVEFINMTDGKTIEKDYHFVVWDTIYQEKNNYSMECNDIYSEINKSFSTVCENIFIGTYIKEKMGWKPLDVTDIPKGEIRIGLATDVNIGDTIDGIWTITGKKIKKHAVWTADLNVGLEGYYKLDSNNFSDSTPNSNDGTNTGTANTSGIIIDGREFDGADYIDASGFSSTSQDYSFSFWLNPDSNSGAQFLFDDDTDGAGDRIVIYSNWDAVGDKVGFFQAPGTPTFNDFGVSLSIGSYQHLVVTLDSASGDAKLYIDGVSVSNISGDYTGIDMGNDITLGAAETAKGNNFDGKMDEVGIWNRTLSVAEIIQIYNGGLGISWTDDFTPEKNISIILNSPEDNFTTENQTIIFNTSINATLLEIINVSLLIDGIVNETNTSGVIGDYIFQKDLSFTNHNWSIRVVDNESNITNSDTRNFFIVDGSLSGIWTDEYQVRIIAGNLTESDFEINNVTITQEQDNLWKINATTGDYETDRARIMKTFFYGTNGGDPRINRTTGLLKIQSIAEKDVGKRGHYASMFTGGDISTRSYTGTFSNTTANTNCSTWSYVDSTGGLEVFIKYELPNGTIINEIPLNTDNTIDETGTDTSTDEIDNPADTKITGTGRSGESVTGRVIYLCVGDITWVETGTGTFINIDFFSNESVPEISPIPNITLNAPENNFEELSSENVTFNITSTISGSTLDSIKLFINDTLNETINISGIENITTFTKIFAIGSYNWSVEVCDINENCALSETRNFTTSNLLEISQTFQTSITEGSLQDISALIQIRSGETISAVSLIYNGTINIGSSSTVGDNIQIIKEDFLTPEVTVDTNITFLWSVILSGGETFNLTSQNQTITNLDIDNCSNFTNQILNLTMVDEEDQFLLSNTTIEVAINLLSSDRSTTVLSLSGKFEDENPLGICMDQNISNTTEYSLDAVILYKADGYAIEYYNIVDSTLDNESGIQQITLFDLNLTDSTDFQLTFTGEDFLPVENALVSVERQYVSENVFKTVELPKTDSNGQTILHLVRNDVIYNIVVMKDGIVLGNFANIIAFCEDFTIGACSLPLNAISNISLVFNYDDEIGLIFEENTQYNETTGIASFSFASTDGTPKIVNMRIERRDVFGNRSVCENTIVSSSGSVSCQVNTEISDTSLVSIISVDGEDKINSEIIIDSTAYGQNGYAMFFIFAIGVLLMFSGSKTWTLVGVSLNYIIGVSLGLIIGGIAGVGSTGIFVLIITIVGIWQLNKERKQ